MTKMTSKFLFYCFNNFRWSFGLPTFAIRRTIASDDNYALETLQSNNWPYSFKTILEVSNDDVELSNITDQYEIDIIQETFENLDICKKYYNSIYEHVAGCFQEHLSNYQPYLLKKLKRIWVYIYILISNYKMNKIQQKYLEIVIDFFFKLVDFLASITW